MHVCDLNISISPRIKENILLGAGSCAFLDEESAHRRAITNITEKNTEYIHASNL
jgi:hypothetical protein